MPRTEARPEAVTTETAILICADRWRIARRLIASGRAGVVVPGAAARAGPADRNVVFRN